MNIDIKLYQSHRYFPPLAEPTQQQLSNSQATAKQQLSNSQAKKSPLHPLTSLQWNCQYLLLCPRISRMAGLRISRR